MYSEAELDVLLHISNLCNYVTQKNSLSSLRSMRQSSTFTPLFTSPPLLLDTMKMLGVYLFRLPARRFLLFDLFGSVAFTEQNMAVFDGQGGGGIEGEGVKGEGKGKEVVGEGKKPWLLSPPVTAPRTLPPAPTSTTPAPRRARPTLSTAVPPPHPPTSRPSHTSGGVALPVVPAGGSGRVPSSPVLLQDSGDVIGGKSKGGLSGARDRSSSVPARGEEGSYRGGEGSGLRRKGGRVDDSVEDLSGGGGSGSLTESSPSPRTSSPSTGRGGSGRAGESRGNGRSRAMASLSSSPVLHP